MKSTRRLLSIILCLVMCLSLLPTAFAVDNGLISSGYANKAKTASFKLYKSGELKINGTGVVQSMEQWSFDDPSYNWDKDDILQTQTETKTLLVQEGIQTIGIEAFKDCPNLKSVTLPTSLTAIRKYAFQNCSGLTEITIPGNVTQIKEGAFMGCVSLKNVNLSTGLQTIGESAFEDCTSLTSILIPANVSKIEAYAFANCGFLESISFTGNFKMDTLIDPDAFYGVEAHAYYPADNNTWNSTTDGLKQDSGYPDFGGRITWHAVTAQTANEGWVQKGDDWYFYVDGEMLTSNWKAFSGKWFYFGKDGRMLTGRQQINGNYYYFGYGSPIDTYSLGARVSGLVTDPDDGKLYYYDENGVWQPSYSGVDDSGLDYMVNGWQQSNDDKWFYIRNKAKVTGWLWSNGYWYYLDPVTGAMVTGWLTWNGNTYYLRPLDKAIADGIADREGSMIAGRSATIGGTVYTFDASGALQGGKMEDNPSGLQNGFRDEGSAAHPDWKFYRSNGTMAKGWELIDSNWYYFDPSTGTMQTGWKFINGAWYYLTKWKLKASGDENDPADWEEVTDPTDTSTPNVHPGRMVTGFKKIPYTRSGVNTVRTYYFTGSGALNGSGWIKVGLKWYYLEAKGEVRTGWFRDGSKWYFLRDDTDPVGEMVTGTYKPSTLPNGSANSKDQYFAASGEWVGDSNEWASGKAGAWQLHDGYWYYYDADGDDYKSGNNNAVTGWQNINGKWYYLSPSAGPAPTKKGYMLTGWFDEGSERYFADPVNGDVKGGWQKIDGVWYYMYPTHDGNFGAMQTGWQFINGNWYHFNEDSSSPTYGALQDGWIKKVSNDHDSTEYWFYLEENQSSNVYGAQWGGGWKQIAGRWYFFDNQHIGYYGKLISGHWIETNGKWYYVRPEVPDHPEESYMVTGLYDVPSSDSKSWPDEKPWPSGLQYFGSDGAWQKLTGWHQIGGYWYYFDSNSCALKDAWVNEGTNTYRLGPAGRMLTGWQDVDGDGKEYYFDPVDGHAWKNAKMDGIDLDSSGKAT